MQSIPLKGVSLVLKPLLVFVPALLLVACSLQPLKDDDDATPLSSVERGELEKTIAAQQRTILGLELRLLARRSEVEQLTHSREQAIQEVVRAKAKLRSRNGKAETVANLAEVKLALEGMRSSGAAEGRGKSLDRAARYVAMSEAALADGNIDGAAYLSGQARVSLDSASVRPKRSSPSSSTVRFSTPQRMVLKQRSNVRAGPGTRYRVVDRLDAGTVVLASGYRGLWVRISEQEETPQRWIHYRLLDAQL